MNSVHCGFVPDSRRETAAFLNADQVARMLGYTKGPASTPVRRIIVFKDGRGEQFHVEEGEYISAVFAHCFCLVASLQTDDASANEVRIDSSLVGHLRSFMGDRIVNGVTAQSGVSSRFLQSVFAAEGGTLYVAL